MEALPQHPSADNLLAHADWVCALARTLVRDPGGADDVAQASWLDVLESPPRDARNLRGWLAQIVRNAAGQRARSEVRRAARERAVARPEALPDTAELVAQAERQREVVGHVLALEEPYRTTLLLRYFQGLEAREIAERQQVPLATVRTRLQRALAQLRERLDRAYGERASWCAALATFARERGTCAAQLSTYSISIGGASVAIAWKVGVAVLVVAATWWAWNTAAHEVEAPRAALVPSLEGRDVVAESTASAPAQPTAAPILEERSAVVSSASSVSPDPTELVEVKRVEGRIVDTSGRPVGGLRIVAFATALDGSASTEHGGSRVLATTAVDGTYALDVPGRFIQVESADEAWLLTCEGQPLGRSEQVRVAVPSVAIEGIVVDEAGAPVPGANVELGFSCSALKEFPFVLYGVESKTWTSLSAADGTFRFAAIPSSCEISVTRDGYETTRAREVDRNPRIVLRASAARPRASRWIRGVVVDDQGAPVAGADVRFGQDQSTSDERGNFEVSVASYDDATPLIAAKPGRAAAVLERFGRTVREEPESLDGTVLRMGGASLAIAGRVLDADGRPCRGWWIDLADGTPSGTSSLTIERESVGSASAATPLETDGDGRFRLDGLRNRTYRVRAFDSSRCLFVVSEPTAAGTDELVLRVPRDAFLPVLRGRVVSLRGRPIGSAIVRQMFTVQVLPSGAELINSCREAQTDAEGRFEFADMPRDHVFLRLDGPQVESAESFAIPASGEVELRASVLCRFRVDARPDDPADRFRVLDGDGRELRITAQTDHASSILQSVQRRDDGFPVCIVGEEAAILVLYQGEVELRRVPLDLQPNELQIVTLAVARRLR